MADLGILGTLLSNTLAKEVFSAILAEGRMRFDNLRQSLDESVSKAQLDEAITTLQGAKLIERIGSSDIDEFQTLIPTPDGLRVGRMLDLDSPSIIHGLKRLKLF